MEGKKMGESNAIMHQLQSYDSIGKKIRRLITTLVTTFIILIGLISVVLLYYTTVHLLQESLLEAAIISADRAEWEMTAFQNIVEELGRNEVLSYEESAVADKQAVISRRIEAYGAINGGLIGVDGIGVFDQVDYSNNKYFTEALAGETYIAEPTYVDGTMQVVIAAPVIEDGEVGGDIIGVVFLSIAHTELNEIVESIYISDGDAAYIINNEGTVVAHSEDGYVSSHYNTSDELQTDSSLKSIAAIEAKMVAGETGFDGYLHKGVYQLIAYAPIDNTDGWSIAITAPLIEFLGVVMLGIVIVILMAVISIFTAKKVARQFGDSIGNPIKTCSERIGMIAKGDLTSDVPEFNTKDEVKILADATADIIEELNHIIGDIDYMLNAMATGDFSVTSQDPAIYIGSYATIQLSLIDIEAALSGTLHLIGDASTLVNAGATQLSASANLMTKGALDQAAAVEELNATIDNVHDIATSNAQEAKEASDQVHAAVTGTNEGKAAIENLSKAMAAMNETSNEIESIIVDIEGIASETNLLSLNASIEAARAGESGRGFAIVAQQIATLAEDSAKSAVNTKELIMKSHAEVEKGNQLTQVTLKAFNDVITSMVAFEKIANKLNDNSYQQDKLMEEISIAIELISQVVHSNSDASQETSAISDDLAVQAARMDELIHEFKFKEDE
ncbi:MAG: methyl-accepting chemotaxis protein [Eubacteriales bacterium]